MLARMSSKRSNILTPTTRFLSADIPRLRNASSPNRGFDCLGKRQVYGALSYGSRTSCMYVLDELASTPPMAMLVPTVAHSSVLACMTLSRASHAILMVVTPWDAAMGCPLLSCPCSWSRFIAFVWSIP